MLLSSTKKPVRRCVVNTAAYNAVLNPWFSRRLFAAATLALLFCYFLLTARHKQDTSALRVVDKDVGTNKFFTLASNDVLPSLPRDRSIGSTFLEADVSRRQINQQPDRWDYDSGKGCLLINYQKYQARPPATKWTKFSQLVGWGWNVGTKQQAVPSQRGTWLADLLTDDDGTPSAGVTGQLIRLKHSGTPDWAGLGIAQLDGDYPATGAVYTASYWTNAGIVAEEMESPAYMVSRGQIPGQWDPQTDNLPQLKQWSDATFLAWADFNSRAGGEVYDIDWIAHHTISTANEETENIILWALKLDFDLDTYPQYANKKTFTPASKSWQALQGTPHVGGACWFLIQHQSQLGFKEITSIEIFQEGTGFGPTLITYFQQVPGMPGPPK